MDGSSNLASLIARYATGAIVPQIVEKVNPKIGKWACAIQDPILAYLLRVNSALARPLIVQAISSRGQQFSACNHGMLQTIAEIHYDSVLEEIGIQSLDDPDPQVAMTAATMLGQFGSVSAESPLWQRYASWSAQWSGRESQLETTFADRVNEKVYQLSLGQNLMQSLATGKSWLSDKTKLQRLSQLTKAPRIKEQLEGLQKMWDDQPLTILLDREPSRDAFHARVAQYEFASLDALKEKLSQFPSGTRFLVSISPTESPGHEQALAQLCAFLGANGMSVVREKIDR